MKLVVAALLLSAAAAAHPAGQRPVVVQAAPDDAVHVGEIVFEGADPKGLSTLVNISEGAVLDGRMIRDAVRALHGSARFARVAAWLEPLPATSLRPGLSRAIERSAPRLARSCWPSASIWTA